MLYVPFCIHTISIKLPHTIRPATKVACSSIICKFCYEIQVLYMFNHLIGFNDSDTTDLKQAGVRDPLSNKSFNISP